MVTEPTADGVKGRALNGLFLSPSSEAFPDLRAFDYQRPGRNGTSASSQALGAGLG